MNEPAKWQVSQLQPRMMILFSNFAQLKCKKKRENVNRSRSAFARHATGKLFRFSIAAGPEQLNGTHTNIEFFRSVEN